MEILISINVSKEIIFLYAVIFSLSYLRLFILIEFYFEHFTGGHFHIVAINYVSNHKYLKSIGSKF